MPARVDLVVVGAGPAGAAAAIAARRHAPGSRVVLLDRQAFPRDKVCGDAIAAHAFDELARLGVTDVEADATGTEPAPPVHELRLRAPDGSLVVGRQDRANRVIPRATFDARLVDHAVAAGAELVRHRVRAVEATADRVTVDGTWTAPWLIAADGASSVVRRLLHIPTPAPRHRAVAARAYAPAAEGQGADDGTAWQRIDMVAAGWPAYAWSFPIGGGRANVGYGMRLDGVGAHGRAALEAHLGDAATAPHDPSTVAMAPIPFTTGRPRPDHGRVLLVGDAAGLVNPLTGEGIFYAIASGRMAAIAVARSGAEGTAGQLYRRMLRRRFGAHWATTSVLARLLDHQRLFPVAVDAARDPAAFRDVAEIGLGEGRATAPLLRAVGRAGWRALWSRSSR